MTTHPNPSNKGPLALVEHPAVLSKNSAAERAIRSQVIARKISGGTRSPSGSQAMVVLPSLFATWQLRGKRVLMRVVRC